MALAFPRQVSHQPRKSSSLWILTDQMGQSLGPSCSWDDAKRDLRLGESSVGSANEDITGHGQLATSAKLSTLLVFPHHIGISSVVLPHSQRQLQLWAS